MIERILITGASGDIGRAIATRLAAPGRELLLHGRDQNALAEVAGAVRGRGAAARGCPADLADQSQVRGLIGEIGDAPLDVLVNAAGTAVVKPVEEIGLDEWLESLAVTVTAPFLLVQGVLPRLRTGASVVNVLSIAARRGFPNWSAYCAAKFALEGFALSLREELRPRGVRVINVYPAATDTALWNGVSGEWDRRRMLEPAEVAEAIAYALERPAGVLVETVEVGDIAGPL
ncbi:MAG TPA: SDR family NAD(P)-dependent oxidoreductase [Thermoanaerobaculaceae bacterium]|nr:SDR family NAD(P)-dependent oxidoreductase [Thermoanaerobaculaceae bacterium]